MTDPHPRARAMRSAATPAERAMWNILRTLPLAAWHFRRQVAFDDRYIGDFASFFCATGHRM
jgi:very-short-patch-repair endonuclease